jgi:hypothetical protein
MSTWQPPWSAQEQVKLTLLPPTQANNSPASRRCPGPGSTAALRAGLRGPCTPRPARRSGLARQPTMRQPRRVRALRATPSQPSPTTATSTTREEDPAGGNRPDATTASPNQRGMARPRRVCPAWVGEQSKHGCAEAQWQTPRRRRRTGGARPRRNPNLRRGRLHHSALPVQPRSALRDPPRLGPAEDDPHEATPLLSCPARTRSPWPFPPVGRSSSLPTHQNTWIPVAKGAPAAAAPCGMPAVGARGPSSRPAIGAKPLPP